MNSSFKTIILCIFTTAAVLFLAYVMWMAECSFGLVSDFPEYYASAKLILAGYGALIYDIKALGIVQHALFPSLRGTVIPLYVPPISLTWLTPIGFLPLEMAPIIWKIFLALSLILSIWLLSITFALPIRNILWLITAVCLSGPAYEALRIDQLTPLLLFAFVIALWGFKKEKSTISALALSFLTLKPQLVLPFLVFILANKQYKVLYKFLSFVLVLALITFIEINHQGLSNYWQLISSSLTSTAYMQPELSATVRGQLLRLFPSAVGTVNAFSTLIAMATLLTIYFAGLKFRNNKNWLEHSLVISMPLGLFTSMHCHDYDLLLLVPSLIVLTKPEFKNRLPIGVTLVGMLLVMIFMVPFYVFIHYNYLLTGQILNPYFFALLFIALSSYIAGMRSRFQSQ